MSSHARYLELAEAHVLGGLELDEQTAIETHLADGCEECEAMMYEARQVADALASAIEPMEVDAALRERVIGRAYAELSAESAQIILPPRWQVYALAASLVGALLLSVQLFRVSDELEAQRLARAGFEEELQYERAGRQLAVDQLEIEARDRARIEQELAGLRGTLQALTASTTETIALAGQAAAPDASARAYLDPESGRLILYVYDLAKAPEGKNYQLWVIANGKPKSAGILQLGDDGASQYDTIAESSSMEGVTIAISLEPEGGRPQPSGPIVLAGK